MDRLDDLFSGGLQFSGHNQFSYHLGYIKTDHMGTQQLSVFRIKDEFYKTILGSCCCSLS